MYHFKYRVSKRKTQLSISSSRFIDLKILQKYIHYLDNSNISLFHIYSAVSSIFMALIMLCPKL